MIRMTAHDRKDDILNEDRSWFDKRRFIKRVREERGIYFGKVL